MSDWLSWAFWVDSTPGVVHFLLASICLVLGAVVLYSNKGTGRHRVLGSIWLVLMITVNTSALTMYDTSSGLNLFHFMAVFSLATIIPGYVSIRRYALTGNQAFLIAHHIYMSWGYFGLAAAGIWQVISRLVYTMIGPGHFDTVLTTLIGLTVLASWAMHRFLKRTMSGQRVAAGDIAHAQFNHPTRP